MKRLFAVTMALVLMLLCFSSCGSTGIGGPKVVNEQQIIEDIKKMTTFSNLDVEIDKIEIIKRQTNTENKIDKVYVTVSGHNDTLIAVRNYQLQYVLYNDGWRIEYAWKYNDADHWDSTKANEEITDKIANECLDSYDVDRLAPWKESDGFSYEVISKEVQQNSYSNDYYSYTGYIVLRYATFDVTITIDMPFSFNEGGNDYWYWSYPTYLDDSNVDYNVTFNDGILGKIDFERGKGEYEKYYTIFSIDVKSYQGANLTADVSVSSEYSDYPDTIVFKDMVFHIVQDYDYSWISEHSHYKSFVIEETGTYNDNNVNIPEYYIDGFMGMGRWVSSYDYITKYMNLYLDVYGRTLELCANNNRIDWYDFENKHYDE